MSNVFVEYDPDRDDYKALQDGRVIGRGPTQLQTGQNAHDRRPHDTILAERQRRTDEGEPDKWRHMFGPKR